MVLKISTLVEILLNLDFQFHPTQSAEAGLGVCLLAPAAEGGQEDLAEVSDEPVDGEVEGGVDHLQQLHRGHGVQVPDGGDALQYSTVQYSTVQAPTQYSDALQMLVPTLSLAWQRRMEVIITASYTDSNSLGIQITLIGLLSTIGAVHLGEWHTRKVATVHSRMVELDRLVFSAGQDCSSALVSVKL